MEIHFQERCISAYHNYLVNGLMTPGFALGNPNAREGFYFLADMVLPGESAPRIGVRLFDEGGRMLAEIRWNRIHENPGGCDRTSMPGGFRVTSAEGDPLLEVRTERFTNGFLTRMTALLHDEKGFVRLAPFGESVRVEGSWEPARTSPFVFTK